jgi:quercetin dioxygenase-like cupin family protein
MMSKVFVPILALFASAIPAAVALAQNAQDVVVQRAGAGAQNPSIGPAQNFTGSVRVDGRFQGSAPARISGGTVTFEPGSRTAWHTHPLGQTLIVIAGVGLVQHWGGAIQEIKPGDTVWIPPGVKHWHGASATSGMTHVAISEALDGKTVEWLEHVTEDQYRP